jgi:hypothetical protein
MTLQCCASDGCVKTDHDHGHLCTAWLQATHGIVPENAYIRYAACNSISARGVCSSLKKDYMLPPVVNCKAGVHCCNPLKYSNGKVKTGRPFKGAAVETMQKCNCGKLVCPTDHCLEQHEANCPACHQLKVQQVSTLAKIR